jgi:hypothetical protein
MLRELGPPRDNLAGHQLQASVPRAYPGHTPSALDKPAKTVVAGTNGSPGGANCVELDDGTAPALYQPRAGMPPRLPCDLSAARDPQPCRAADWQRCAAAAHPGLCGAAVIASPLGKRLEDHG